MYFNHEKFECYQVALGVARWAASVKVPMARLHLRDQLIRAADSMVLNIAEGGGRPIDGGARRNFFAIASGSAAEVGAILDLLQPEDGEARQHDCRRVCAMLARLR